MNVLFLCVRDDDESNVCARAREYDCVVFRVMNGVLKVNCCNYCALNALFLLLFFIILFDRARCTRWWVVAGVGGGEVFLSNADEYKKVLHA